MLTKLSQWVTIWFCSLLHVFLSKSHDLRCSVKLKMYSLFDKSFRTIAYVITPHQVHLSQTTKHWDSFVSHCIFTPRLWASSRNHNDNKWPAPLAPHTFNTIITDAANKASVLTDTPSFLSSLTSQLLLISQLIRVKLPRFVYSFFSPPCAYGWKVLASMPMLSWATAWGRLWEQVCLFLMWRKQPRQCQWAVRYVLFHSYLYLLLTEISF